MFGLINVQDQNEIPCKALQLAISIPSVGEEIG